MPLERPRCLTTTPGFIFVSITFFKLLFRFSVFVHMFGVLIPLYLP